jgi:hypothetical protein
VLSASLLPPPSLSRCHLLVLHAPVVVPEKEKEAEQEEEGGQATMAVTLHRNKRS